MAKIEKPEANPEKLVAFVVEQIIGCKGFRLEKTEEGDLISLEIRTEKTEDIGKIVGKGGTTIWAIRRLASIAGVNLGKKVQVNLLE